MVALTAPGTHDAHADGAGRLIARARDNRRSRGQSGSLAPSAETLPQISGDSKTFGKQGVVDSDGLRISADHRLSGHVEHQRARCVGHVDGAFAAQAETDVVLRAA